MATTVADQVYERVVALMADGASQTEAIRRVAEEMDRSVPATSSAYTAGARRASADMAGDDAPATSRAASPQLFAEMLPLVEAGATVEQAARRFGDEDAVEEIAAGFTRWARQEFGDDFELPGDGEADPLTEAQDRIDELEAEVRRLRHEVARARQTLSRARAIIDAGLGETGT
ncbi:hypothetical protein [Miltoncostaea marina]|uniref:hypothetical protein n=1 Tax=Miltoncostaea marina TaxID=2843215 RepID=UPI001C3D7735|nr:hypothetical protein [Miltoncostaea marina]